MSTFSNGVFNNNNGESLNGDLDLPKINISKTKKSEESNGKEVNINIKSSKKSESTTTNMVKSTTTTPTKYQLATNNGQSNRRTNMLHSAYGHNNNNHNKKLNFEISLNSHNKENEGDISANGNTIDRKVTSKGLNKKSSTANIAVNVNLALNMDDSEEYNFKNDNKKITSNSKTSSNLEIPQSPQSKMETASSIKVAVRIRPLTDNNDPTKTQDKNVEILIKDNQMLIPHKKDIFEFDYCFDSSNPELINFASQEKVYKNMGQPLLNYAFQGYNVCLFAYGQSGSGKTYTMMGKDENPGITPRFLNDLFRKIGEKRDIDFIVNISFMEIYNEKIYDLLSDEFDKMTKKLRVREHPQTGPYVEELTVYTVESYEEAMKLLKQGMNNRSIATTGSNENSNRSHTIFSIILVQNKKIDHNGNDDDSPQTETSCISKINLVDLAGSEKVGLSNSDRFREGTSINKSLLTLGKVISQLAENSNQDKPDAYVPYRDSTLTYLLKESLGGNSRTSMIATINPAKNHLDETLNTLRYASIAQKVINIVHINEDPKMKIINGLLKQISFLKKEVDKTKNISPISELDVTESGDEWESEKLFEKMNKLNQKLKFSLENLEKHDKTMKNIEKSETEFKKFQHKFLDQLNEVLEKLKEDKDNFSIPDDDHQELNKTTSELPKITVINKTESEDKKDQKQQQKHQQKQKQEEKEKEKEVEKKNNDPENIKIENDHLDEKKDDDEQQINKDQDEDDVQGEESEEDIKFKQGKGNKNKSNKKANKKAKKGKK